ncbi:hypothetical protein ACV3YE_03635 [Clostridium perfringens]|uniref:hypothetical protein n=1 Tax=Clostridium perfringens TaxID=1502 RepID=UPI003F91BA9A
MNKNHLNVLASSIQICKKELQLLKLSNSEIEKIMIELTKYFVKHEQINIIEYIEKNDSEIASCLWKDIEMLVIKEVKTAQRNIFFLRNNNEPNKTYILLASRFTKNIRLVCLPIAMLETKETKNYISLSITEDNYYVKYIPPKVEKDEYVKILEEINVTYKVQNIMKKAINYHYDKKLYDSKTSKIINNNVTMLKGIIIGTYFDKSPDLSLGNEVCVCVLEIKGYIFKLVLIINEDSNVTYCVIADFNEEEIVKFRNTKCGNISLLIDDKKRAFTIIPNHEENYFCCLQFDLDLKTMKITF